ncbi:tetratricopeptide repeat protein [Desulfosarcina widdelii]|nr:glycosyltransferase family 41 protein [Desulfosarcina widdelii]
MWRKPEKKTVLKRMNRNPFYSMEHRKDKGACVNNIFLKGADSAEQLHRLGTSAYQKGSLNKAEHLIRQAIAVKADNPHFFNDLGTVLRKGRKYEEALSCYREAMRLKPEYDDACCNLAQTFHMLKDGENARKYYTMAIRTNADFLRAHFNLGMLFHEKQQFEKAIASYKQVLRIKPGHAQTHYFIGLAYQETSRFEEAIRYYGDAIRYKPNHFDAYNNMGTAYLVLNMADKAIECFQKAIKLNPGSDAVHANMGNALQEQGRYERALHWYRVALKLKPSNAVAWLNMGITWGYLNKKCKALSCYRKALRIDPTYTKACAYLVRLLYQLCSWKDLKVLDKKLDDFTHRSLEAGAVPDETPFQNITRHADPALNMKVASSWSRRMAETKRSPQYNFDEGGGGSEVIRIGYLSNTFRNHPGAQLISGVFRHHDRSRFGIYCFSYGANDGSIYRKRIEKDSDRFFDIFRLSDGETADLIHRQQIDILVDLRGFTQGSRLGINALRPAPIHVAYLGYPGTTGADYIDYIIADKIVVPANHASHFGESVVYMPHCYQANDNLQKISDRTMYRGEFGIPQDAFVFCSFATHYKLEPVMFDCWMRILKRVPQSVLCLLTGERFLMRNIKREAIRADVAPDRLIFLEKLPKDEHLKRLQLMDVSLDTRIYNGHTTTSDSLWAGIPVLTLKGDHFASRVSASILQAIALPELIVDEIGKYEDLAVKLATDPGLFGMLKQKVGKNRLTEPLFDTSRFTRNLESAYQEMIHRYRSGQLLRRIEVQECLRCA